MSGWSQPRPRRGQLRARVRRPHRHLPGRLPGTARLRRRRAVRVVLGADVAIGALDGSDPRYAHARTLLRGCQRRETARLLSLVDLTEVLVAPAADRNRLRTAREAIPALGVQVHQPGEAVGAEAAPPPEHASDQASRMPTASRPPATQTPRSSRSTRRSSGPPSWKESR